MEVFKLNSMFKGWFIGDFDPSLHKADYEVGIKRYISGDKEPKHYHKEAIEFTVVVSGIIKMNDKIYIENDIIKVDLNEEIEFECIEDAITVVVKTKSVKNDKYLL